MEIYEVDINSLKPAEYNPRQMTKSQADDLRQSLDAFGLVEPIVVNGAENRKNVIIGGHQRYNISKLMGKETIPVVYVNIPDIEKEKELNLRLNKNLGEWDWDKIASFDEELLKTVGFSEEIEHLFEKNVEEDEVPEVEEKAHSKLGEIYRLGRHRLMCGDATKIEDVEKLMDGKKVDMVFTDPPYGIGWNADKQNLPGNHNFGNMKNDDNKLDFSILFSYDKKCNMVVFGANNFIKQLPHNGTWICWDKRMKAEADNVIGSAFELAWTNRHAGYYKIYRIMHGGVINSDNKNERRLHPTQKPIKLCNAILNDQKAGNLILDLFGGSGSTLIACEQSNRTCYMMEIDTKYIDVIRKRYARFIGKEEEWENITKI